MKCIVPAKVLINFALENIHQQKKLNAMDILFSKQQKLITFYGKGYCFLTVSKRARYLYK